MPLNNIPDDPRESPKLTETRPTAVARILKNAERQANKGQGDIAYTNSLNATNLAPQDPQAWYIRAQTAPSFEEKLICLSRVCSLDPGFHNAKYELYVALRDLLGREPSLAYLKETADLYQVKSGYDLLINVPKNRAFEEPYLKRKSSPLKPAFRWLNLALFALPLGGIGAFIIAPLLILASLRYQSKSYHRQDHVRALVLMLIAIIIWLISVPISALFLIHFLR
jgi:hypothetical protein